MGQILSHAKELAEKEGEEPIKEAVITVPPGKTTGWLEVGGLMATLNHGSWKVGSAAAGPPPPPPGNETLCKILFEGCL